MSKCILLEGPPREAEGYGGRDLRLQEHLCVLDTESPVLGVRMKSVGACERSKLLPAALKGDKKNWIEPVHKEY